VTFKTKSMMIVIGWSSPTFAIRRDVVLKMRESWRDQTFYYQWWREPRLVASYGVVAHVVSKRQISTLRAISWGILGTLSLVLGVCAFSAVGAEQPAAKQKPCAGKPGMLCKSAP
jgi:hypothetical protein